ncbi:MAG: SDR family oxidoreductase [Desulfobacteraceae bacterium]|jgi:UDP-glucose 4-epimerase|nr:SDR family oxidoreductase [Desulfobacteraceae bacterium]
MNIDFKKALITGGAGFIGSHLAEALVAGKCKVTVLDNLSSGSLANLEPLKARITFHRGDIRQRDILEQAAEGSDVIFHLAAVVSVPQTVDNPVEAAEVNDIGTLRVFEAARARNVPRIVFSSSCAVYGDGPLLPKTEIMNPKPTSPYAVQKLSAEHYGRIYSELFGLESVSLRYFNVYGPRQDPSSPYSGVISIFMTRALSNQAPVIYGDGNQSRDFVYVKDVVNANLLAAAVKRPQGSIFNIGTGFQVRINRLWELIASMSGHPKLEPIYESARDGDIRHSYAGMDYTKSKLKFNPEFSLEQGLDMTLEWYRGQMAKF